MKPTANHDLGSVAPIPAAINFHIKEDRHVSDDEEEDDEEEEEEDEGGDPEGHGGASRARGRGVPMLAVEGAVVVDEYESPTSPDHIAVASAFFKGTVCTSTICVFFFSLQL